MNVTQQVANFSDFFDPNIADPETFTVSGTNTNVEVYDSQWVASGQLLGGVEWQVTPKTALAFEAGLRFEGERELVNGEDGDTRISIPFGIRGSYNF